MDNFKRPYFSRSIAEFWRRWHISLSTWFKDYLYIPLGGNRVKVHRWYFNLFIVFLVSGLWHGANWTFVVWGALHGFYIIFSIITKKYRKKLADLTKINKFPKIHQGFQILVTFILVNIGWVFFRANTINDAFYILKNMFVNISFSLKNNTDMFFGSNTRAGLIILVSSILFMEIIHLMQEHFRMRQFLSNKPIYLRWSIYIIIILAILIFGQFGEQEFIYFQF